MVFERTREIPDDGGRDRGNRGDCRLAGNGASSVDNSRTPYPREGRKASNFCLFSRPLSAHGGGVITPWGGIKEGEPAGGEVGAGSPFMPQAGKVSSRLLHKRNSRPGTYLQAILKRCLGGFLRRVSSARSRVRRRRARCGAPTGVGVILQHRMGGAEDLSSGKYTGRGLSFHRSYNSFYFN